VVREWAETKDCFWNIAGLAAVYGDPWRWEQLYQFNKPKMKNQDNPNLIYPGMIIEIPSLKNEKREGTYEVGKTYPTP
jgi:nucleoid-associated protein YgaU